MSLFPTIASSLLDLNQQEWPLPLSPLPPEHSKHIELHRAMVAEAASKHGPAFSSKDVLFEDEWLLVINKAPGVYSGHVLASVPAFLTIAEDAVNLPHLHLANRLDRDTSGVMVVTKCKKAAGKMTAAFEGRRVSKTYLALCIGRRPQWDEIMVESGHGRSRWGAWRVYANADVGRKLPEKAVVRDMVTRFSVLSVNGERSCRCGPSSEDNLEKILASKDSGENTEKLVAIRDGDYSHMASKQGDVTESNEVLLRAYPGTGRTHQIRLHCQFLGLSLRGDVKYGGAHFWKGTRYDTHALHAESMSFRHPITSQDMHFSAPLPEWARQLCKQYSLKMTSD